MALPLIHQADAADLNRKSGINAYEWVSFHPERRADQDIADYVRTVNEFAAMCEQVAQTPEQVTKAVEEVERFRLGFITHRTAVWAASSRTASPMITGPARFPVEKNRKRMDTYERRAREFFAWIDKARRAARRNLEKIAEPPREVDNRAPITETLDGVEIVRNFALDRVQIFFGGKPDEETRSRLKSSGWHWSPREGAWQRKLTNNALYSARYCITGGAS
jgi:hypothetical protein